MDTLPPIYQLPIALTLVVIIGFLLIVVLVGQALGNRRRSKDHDPTPPSDFLPSSTLALLGLLLGFTLSMAISRFEERRHLVIQEANAISSAYIRTRLVAPAQGTKIAGLLKTYLDSRIAFYDAHPGTANAERENNRLKTLQVDIWRLVADLLRTHRGGFENFFALQINQMFDIENERSIVLEKTLPVALYWLILLVMTVGIGTYAYNSGLSTGRRFALAPLGLILGFGLVFVLILDLDRPQAGLVRITQGALISLKSSLSDF